MDLLHSVKIYHGDGLSVTVLASLEMASSEVIRLALEKMQVFEDKTYYQLYEGRANETESSWRPLQDEDRPACIQEEWAKKDLRFFLKRKDRESLELLNIINQHLTPESTSEPLNDLCFVEDLSEEAMVTNLKARFSRNTIYTYVGSILVSINPYYFFAIYNPKHTALYQGKPLGQLPPHIFAVADDAYSSMLADKENQSIVISGESGAGKTEATKFLLHHLMSLSAKIDKAQSLELITLGTGPVLEAFGNAMTVANDNSSRFGKFIQVKFKENGAYYGASIEKYLLEKSRIISHSERERNYHVFYYLLAGAEPELRQKLHLVDSQQYSYLAGESISSVQGNTEYQKLKQSLSMLNFSEVTQLRMFTVLAAILHIGNITFLKNDDSVFISNMQALEVVSELLQVPQETLKSALTHRKTRAGRGLEYFTTPYKLDEAVITRDSLAKGLYGALFDWIVDKVNESLTPDNSHTPHKGNCIGVLDIFGFEVFQKNRFEQFCINFANEHLQQYFNKHVFQREQAEYFGEGINWVTVSYVDNTECLDLIAKRPTGLIHLLDEECSFPGADDRSLLHKFDSQHKSHPYYKSPQVKSVDPTFSIVHYAREVSYSIKGFREKNSEMMRQDIVDVLTTSRADLVRAIIGLRSCALHHWHMAFLKYRCVMVLMGQLQQRKAGRPRGGSVSPQKLCKTGSTPSNMSSTPLRAGSTPSGTTECSDITIIVPNRNKRLSAEPFDFEFGGVLSSSFGLKANKTYDLVKRNPIRHTKEHKSSSSSPSPDQEPGQHSRNPSHISLEVSEPSVRVRSGSISCEGSAGGGKTHKPPGTVRKRSLTKEDSRVHLPSISQIQEKLRTRLSWSKKRGIDHVEKPHTPSFGRSGATRHGSTLKTVSGQFHQSLLALMETLEQTHPYFVRCIKSNNKKAVCEFDSDLVLRQLRYTGMMETVRIRKQGYPVRMTFESFYERYQFLIGTRKHNLPDQIQEFLSSIGAFEGIQMGKTKVFMRDTHKHILQKKLQEQVLDRIVVIQRWFRAKLQRCRFLHLKRCTIILQSLARGWLARRQADQMRTNVCSAVVIQSAWRGWTVRRQYVVMKHSAVVIQAHWRGRSMRKRYQTLLAEYRRQEEARRKKLEEARRVEYERRRLEQEMEKLEKKREKLLEEKRKLDRRKEEQDRERVCVTAMKDQIDASKALSPLSGNTKTSPDAIRTPPGTSTTSLDTIKTPPGTSTTSLDTIKTPPGTSTTSLDTTKTPPGTSTTSLNTTKTSDGAAPSYATSTIARDMWNVLSEFDRVLDNAKRLSSSSESVIPSTSDHTPECINVTPAAIPNPDESTARPTSVVLRSVKNIEKTAPIDLNQPISRERKRSHSVDLKSIISRFEDIPSSPILLSSSRKHPFAAEHERSESVGTRDATTPTSPPPVIGRVQSPFLTRKSYDSSTSADTVTTTSSGRRSTTPSKDRSVVSSLPVITVNSTKSEVVEESHDNLTAPVASDKRLPENSQLKASGNRRASMGHSSIELTGTQGCTSEPVELVLPTGPEERAHKLCEGWSPRSSDGQELSPTSPWTPEVPTSLVVISNPMRLGEEDDEILWMETPIDDHLVPMRPRVESEVLRRPPFQNDTVMHPPSQTHPLESPPTRRRDVRPASLRRWRKKAAANPVEASSEFTQCLSASEVQNLNQERLLSPDNGKTKAPKISIWHKKPKSHSPTKEPTSPVIKKTHFATPSPKPNKHAHVEFKLNSGADEKNASSPHVSDRMRHNFHSVIPSKSEHCYVCNKSFAGVMRKAMRCIECEEVIVHRHCVDRAPPCKAHIASGAYVTMSRQKVIKNLDDIDHLGKFLLDKLSVLNSANTTYSPLENAFKKTIHDFHASLVSTYSLAYMPGSTNNTGASSDVPTTKCITLGQLMNNFSNSFKSIAKKENLSDAHLAIGINQFKTIVDEFTKQAPKTFYPENFDPSTLKRKSVTGGNVEIKVHNGHKFARQQFKVRTVCELCNGDIPLLERGEVCEECGYTCHENCYKSTTQKCEGKGRVKHPDVSKSSVSQFGVPLESLVPKDRGNVPDVIEKCFLYIETHGLYTLGIYRKSAGATSKKAVRSALEEGTLSTEHDSFNVHAVASTVGTFFRELPEPLLTRELYIEFIRATEITDRNERLQALHQLIGRLPPLNHVVFERLIFHLARIAQQEQTNKMGSGNLAIVFAPTLLRSSTDNPQDVLADLPKQTQCLEEIITEQVNKLNVTLKDIEVLSTFARSRECQLTELVKENKKGPQAQSSVNEGHQMETAPDTSGMHSADTAVEATREKLTRELQEIERERVKLTVNLPTLEPFSFIDEEWNADSTPPSFRRKAKSFQEPQIAVPTETLLEEGSLVTSPEGSDDISSMSTPLSHPTKNRVKMPSKRPPSRGVRWSEPAAERTVIHPTFIGRETTL